MERRRTEIRHRELEPLPEVEVYYTPETQTLSIQNGLRVKDGEEMARGLTAFYDAEGSLVAIDLESAELLSNRSWMLSCLSARMTKPRSSPRPNNRYQK